MKILKEGKIKEPPPIFWAGMVFNCSNCETQFQLEEEDSKIVGFSIERRLFGKTLVGVKCPCCGLYLQKII